MPQRAYGEPSERLATPPAENKKRAQSKELPQKCLVQNLITLYLKNTLRPIQGYKYHFEFFYVVSKQQ